MTDSCFLPARYTPIEATLRGSQTTLVRAHDNDTNSTVALKLIHAPAWMTAAESDSFLSRVAATLEPLAGFSHPGIAAVQQVERVGDALLISRDFVEGRPLSRLAESRWILEANEARRIAAEVGASLDALASIGLSHHALTPDNIIVDETGGFIVTDASIRHAASQFSVAGLSCSVRTSCGGSDLHALASLVCQAVTGLNPNLSGSALNVELPAGMRESIRRALTRERAFRTAGEFAAALEPASTPDLFRYAWRPAAAVGLLAALATVGGNAVTESGQAAERETRKAAPRSAVTASEQPKLIRLASLSPVDAAALAAAVRRQGPAVLANPAIADLLELDSRQRMAVEICLDEHRAQVENVVEAAASGRQIDSAAAMSELRLATNSRLVAALNDSQRAGWESLSQMAAQSGDTSH